VNINHPAVTDGANGWQRVHDSHDYRRTVYWRKSLSDKTRLTASRVGSRWHWKHYRGSRLLTQSTCSWTTSTNARHAADELFSVKVGDLAARITGDVLSGLANSGLSGIVSAAARYDKET
jgi:hypothetical protein